MALDDPNNRESVPKIEAIHICDIDIAIPGGPEPCHLQVYLDPSTGWCFGIDKYYLISIRDEIASPFSFADILKLP